MNQSKFFFVLIGLVSNLYGNDNGYSYDPLSAFEGYNNYYTSEDINDWSPSQTPWETSNVPEGPLPTYVRVPAPMPEQREVTEAVCYLSSPVSISQENGAKLYVGGEYLYWRASQEGLSVRTKTSSREEEKHGNVYSCLNKKSRSLHFKWHSGYRIDLAYQPACSLWGMGARWTHFNPEGNHPHIDGNDIRCKEGRDRFYWDLKYNVVDLIFDYRFNLCPDLVFRPLIGIKGAKIDQKTCGKQWLVQKNDITVFKNKSIFHGIGPMIGLEADWSVGCGFRFYLSLTGASLYGNSNLHLSKAHIGFNRCHVDQRDFDCIRSKKNIYGCQGVIDAAIGVRWETTVACTCVFVQLGAEHHRYFNHNLFKCRGDLCLDGGTFALGLIY